MNKLEKINKPVNSNLDEAAIEAFKQIVDSDKNNFLEIFKAGAQWQKEQGQYTIELAEDHAYLAGQEKIIDKACDWLSNVSIEDMTYKYNNFDTSEDWYKFIKDFKKVMEE